MIQAIPWRLAVDLANGLLASQSPGGGAGAFAESVAHGYGTGPDTP